MHNTKQPGMLKTPVGFQKSVSYSSSDVQIHRTNTNAESWGTAWN